MVKFVATKKMTTYFFHPSFVAVYGSDIWDPGWVKFRSLDNHPGSATLGKSFYVTVDHEKRAHQNEI